MLLNINVGTLVMQRLLVFKIITIFLLVLLLLIPLNMIRHLITERMTLRNGVVAEIARSSAVSQTILGPILVVPYNYIEKNESNVTSQKEGNLYFLPETFKLNGKLEVEKRKRGIYEARVYNLTHNQLTGYFNIPPNFGITASKLTHYQFGQPFIAVGIKDIRGLNNPLEFTVDGTKLDIIPGTGTLNQKLKSGIHVLLDKTSLLPGGSFSYQIAMQLIGTSSLNIVPIGKQTTVTLHSNWPHPSFEGSFLPSSRNVSKQGFTATWQTNFFATNMEDELMYCLSSSCCSCSNINTLGVSLINPVDQYLKSDRAIKYSLLFIGLTFFGFFIFEMVKRLAIHPIQYSFVGIALALFFLLLLSLSEHIGFNLAYFCSAASCIGLISFYMMGILANKKQSIIFGIALLALYSMLYVLLNGEDYSLLLGSILVFGVLAIAMIATRKLNWYQITTFTPVNLSKEKATKESRYE